MTPSNNVSPYPPSPPTNDDRGRLNDEEPTDSSLGDREDEGPLFRLFVGCVPKAFVERDIKPLFNAHGSVADIICLKDHLGLSRGCAFVSYRSKKEAENACQALDRNLTLPGSNCPIEESSIPPENRHLFFSRASPLATEETLRALFSQLGVVEEVNLFTRRTGCSKGSGFVSFQTREQANKAIEVLDNCHMMEGSSEPLSVQWADPDLQTKKKQAVEGLNTENRMLFFAKVLRSATEDEVKDLFTCYGSVYEVNLFRAFQGAPTTKGCGLVTMSTHEDAMAAIDALDCRYTWEGMESPMVVKWMDSALQRRRREQHLASMRQGLAPNMSMDSWMPLAYSPVGGSAQVQSRSALMGPLGITLSSSGGLHHSGLGGPAGPEMLMEMHETPPAGCAPDAIKLFVGNIPKNCTEEQILPFFETIGNVVELIIVRDKVTQESKGSAFVWYTTRSLAERAILQFNLRHALPDAAGEQDRPLVVRKAKARVKAHSMNSVMSQQHPSVAMLTGNGGSGPRTVMDPRFVDYHQQFYQQQQQLIFQQPATAYYNPRMVVASHQPPGVMMSDVNHHSLPQALGAPGGGPQGLGLFQGQRHTSQLVGQADFYNAYGQGAIDTEHFGQYMTGISSGPSAVGGGGSSGENELAMSIAINQQQLTAVNTHLYSVQTMSGAQLNITPGGQGLFHLVVSGSKAQVEAARSLVSSIISSAGV